MSDNETKTSTTVDLSAESDRVQTGRLPRFNYQVRIVEEPQFKISKSSGNPMLVFKLEIVSPESVNVKGEEYKTAGIGLTLYAAFTQDEETGIEINRQLAKVHRALSLPLQFQRDQDTGLPQNDEGVPIRYVGTDPFWIQGDSEEKTQVDDNDQPLTNPVTGEVLKGWSYNVRQVYA